MYLIQILLPLADNQGRPFPQDAYAQVGTELMGRFHGLTAYARAPAEGFWQEQGAQAARDEIIVLEVMAASVDRDWWAAYRQQLEHRFRQDRIVIRAQIIDVL